MTIQTTVERLRIPRGGALNSADINKFIDAVVLDLSNLTRQVNTNVVDLQSSVSLLLREMADLKQRVDQIEKHQDFDELRRAWENLRILATRSMGDTTGITFPAAATSATHPNINTTYGQATVPLNGIQSKFYSNSIISGEIVPISQNLNITVTSVFDDGDGLADQEAGFVKRSEGDPKRAFNGDNQSYWIRRVEFDLESDVSEIQVELTVQVPDQANAEANVLYIRPYPVGETDITALLTSPDLTEPTDPVPGFTAVDNSKDQRYFFEPKVVSQIRIHLRQRNWFEENGRKVFEYGLQELGLQLAEFDKAYDASASLGQNHTFVTAFDAPPGFRFSTLHLFTTDPDYTLEAINNRHMHFKVALDVGGGDVRWDSDISPLPQTLVQGINLGNSNSTIYVLTTLNWVETADGVEPLFEAGTTPVLNSIGIQYSVVPE